MAKVNVIVTKSFDFALGIISLYQKLINEKEYVLSKQLLRSGTSIGANVQESISAQSKKDFINKLSISLKEARETKYWLSLLSQSDLTKVDLSVYLVQIEELIKILYSIVNSSKEK